ncbi:hypothetical protein AB2N08_07120 [Massilia aurea]|uniref:hypothetical protein n=1 Tax=Massilia aurea TaxID=373040 RepID=UPI003462B3E8
MPIVKLSISDLRLPVGRQLSAIVRCVRPANVGDIDTSTQETIAIVERVPATPVTAELGHGTWCVFVKNAYFPESVNVITVPESIHEQAINIVIGREAERKIRYETSDDSHPYGLLPRGRLAPSRGHTSSNNSQSTARVANKDMFLVKLYDYRPSENAARAYFSDANSFDARMKYWMSDWRESEPYVPTEVWPGEVFKEHSQNLSVLNLKLDLSKTVRNQIRRKALLRIKFSDQAFSVVLPQISPDEGGNVDPLTLEISYVNERVRCTSEIDRLRGVRLHTTDPKFDAVTQFLADGEMPNAVKVWTSLAKKMLFNKHKDPVAAAAAALVLVHASMGEALPDADKAKWESWLHTLRKDFYTISDGAVGDAWINALRPGDQHVQMTEASLSFELAVRRGLPMFTEAVRLLKRGAEWAFENNKNSDELNAIRWLTRQVVPGNALTTIRHEEK